MSIFKEEQIKHIRRDIKALKMQEEKLSISYNKLQKPKISIYEYTDNNSVVIELLGNIKRRMDYNDINLYTLYLNAWEKQEVKDDNMFSFITSFLNDNNITWEKQNSKVVISTEFQKDILDEELGIYMPYIITDYSYPNLLNKKLSSFNETLDDKFGYNFECDWDGTFSVILSN